MEKTIPREIKLVNSVHKTNVNLKIKKMETRGPKT